MSFSQSFVVAWLQFFIASAVLLTLAAVALKKLPQPVDRIRLIQIALAAMMVLPPLIAFAPVSLLRLNLFPPTATPSASNSPAQSSPTIPRIMPESESSPTAFAEHRSAPADALRENRSTSAATADMVRPSSSTDRWLMFAALIVISHAAAVVFFCIEWTIGRRRLRRMCRAATSPSEMVMREWTAVSQGQGENVRLLVSSAIDVPLMFGCRRPVVLVPRELDEAGGSALRFCLSHEWSHIARGDARTWTAISMCQFFLWMQPAYWSLRKELRLCQDMLADDHATASSDDAVAYSELLVSFARRRLAVRAVGALTLIDRPSQLTRRITMLLKRPISVRSTSSWKLSLSLALTAIACTVFFGGIRFDGVRADEVVKKQLTPSAKKTVDAPPATEKAEPIKYTCRIVDIENGEGIAGARVIVRRATLSSVEHRILEETEHATDAEGEYIVEIPAEQAAERYLYIELDVEHDDYASRKGFGYGFSMIPRNEKLGARPFFERTELYPGEAVTGIVLSPDGEPLEGIAVQGYSTFEFDELGDRHDSGSFADAVTDSHGGFRLNLHKKGEGLVWILPKDFAIVEKFVGKRRGDLGTIQLEAGYRSSGRLLNADGTPVPDCPVTIEIYEERETGKLAVASSLRRAAITDADGRFKFDPLPSGTYRVTPEGRLRDPLHRRHLFRSLPGVFLGKIVVLNEETSSTPLEIRAVPHVTIHAQIVDSSGQRTRGHAFSLHGKIESEYWHGSGRPDEEGQITLQVPQGLAETEVQLMTNETGALRYRLGTDSALEPYDVYGIDFGTMNKDVNDFEIVRYRAPVVLIKATDEMEQQLNDFQVSATYPWGKHATFFEDNVATDVVVRRQEDGRYRTTSMLPDEDVTFTITAEGYEPVVEKINLPEGETKELVVRLKKVK